METQLLIEALTFKYPEIRKPLLCLNILSEKRNFSPTYRPEFDNILNNFNEIKIVSVIGIIQVTAIIGLRSPIKKYPIILIKGNNSEYHKMTKTMISSLLIKFCSIKDFLPQPFVKKIIYIENFNDNKCEGLVFSEFLKNKWTLEDPLKVPITNYNSCGCGLIIRQIIEDILGDNV